MLFVYSLVTMVCLHVIFWLYSKHAGSTVVIPAEFTCSTSDVTRVFYQRSRRGVMNYYEYSCTVSINNEDKVITAVSPTLLQTEVNNYIAVERRKRITVVEQHDLSLLVLLYVLAFFTAVYGFVGLFI